MTEGQEKSNIEALASLLDAKGLDAGDFIDVINALAGIKKRDAAKEVKEEKKSKAKEKKIFVDKEFVYETRTDVFVYRDGRTKSGRYYVRIYDPRTKEHLKKVLGLPIELKHYQQEDIQRKKRCPQ